MRFVTTYVKVVDDKEKGILMSGVFLGGLGETQAEADLIATDCTNTIRGGTVLAKIVKIKKGENLIDAMYDAADRFDVMLEQMKEANETINRSKK